MKQSYLIADRQNDAEALELLRASHRCLRNERIIKYIMIVLSFGICLAAIFNRYLHLMLPNLVNIEEIQQTTATYINLISGGILVAGMPLGFYCTRMHTEGTVLRDRYDAYVFDNAPNLSILRPISQTFISIYSKKVHKTDDRFKNFLYPAGEQPDQATAQFEYIREEAHSDYKLYLSIQPFFLTLWLGFCILIIIIAVSFNDMFVTTLINIMIPSLSAITTIGNSWYNCRLQMRQLTNLITIIDQIQCMPHDKRQAYICDKENMRMLADGLFNYRSSAFVIPNFLVKRHQKALANLQKNENKDKTELPKLQTESSSIKSNLAVTPPVKRQETALVPVKNQSFTPVNNQSVAPVAEKRQENPPATVKRHETATPARKPTVTVTYANKPAAASPNRTAASASSTKPTAASSHKTAANTSSVKTTLSNPTVKHEAKKEVAATTANRHVGAPKPASQAKPAATPSKTTALKPASATQTKTAKPAATTPKKK